MNDQAIPTKQELLDKLEEYRSEYSMTDSEVAQAALGYEAGITVLKKQKDTTLTVARSIQSFMRARSMQGDSVASHLSRMFGLHPSVSRISDGSLQAAVLLVGMFPGIRKKQIESVLGWKYDRINATLRKLRRLGIVKAERVSTEGRGLGRNAYSLDYGVSVDTGMGS